MFIELFESVKDFEWTDEIIQQAIIDTRRSNYENLLVSGAMGVIQGEEQPIDRVNLKSLAKDFENTREIIRKTYGDYVYLYRWEPTTKLIKDKKTKLYGSKKDAKTIWKKFYEESIKKGLRKLDKRKVKVDDILAVHADKYGYKELIVKS